MRRTALTGNPNEPLCYPARAEDALGVAWDVRCGFHAKPSMRHLHMHVISSDLSAPRLRRKQHYNSFNPNLGYFVSLAQAQQCIREGRGLAHDERYYAALGNGPMRSFDGTKTFPTIGTAKQALYQDWVRYLEHARKDN